MNRNINFIQCCNPITGYQIRIITALHIHRYQNNPPYIHFWNLKKFKKNCDRDFVLRNPGASFRIYSTQGEISKDVYYIRILVFQSSELCNGQIQIISNLPQEGMMLLITLKEQCFNRDTKANINHMNAFNKNVLIQARILLFSVHIGASKKKKKPII